MSMFQKATKNQLKARLALDGPSGAGKTWTALSMATVLGKRIAVIDTERGRARLYSHKFEFDVLDMAPPYDPARCSEALNAAEHEGYDVVIVDSMSHFWQGEGGTLDIKEGAAKRLGGNDYAGWSVATPALRHLVDTMLAIDAHLIVTMRSKMDHVQDRDANGKVTIRKVGMAPVMRDGIEYEFDIVGDIDLEHRIVISKSRCDVLADQVIQPHREIEAAETFRAWLDDGEPLASRNDIDSLKDRMNHLPGETRAVCKKRFVDLFGRPDTLVASALPAAQAFVAEYETVPLDSGGHESADSATSNGKEDHAPDAGGAALTSEGGATGPAATDALIDAAQQRQLHIDMGNIAKMLGHTNSKGNGDSKWSDLVLDALVLEVTGGRTSTTKLLTAGEYGRLLPRMGDVKEGRLAVVVHGPDAVDLVQGRMLLSFARDGDGELRLTGTVERPAQPEGASA